LRAYHELNITIELDNRNSLRNFQNIWASFACSLLRWSYWSHAYVQVFKI